jgi:hypothetical protein
MQYMGISFKKERKMYFGTIKQVECENQAGIWAGRGLYNQPIWKDSLVVGYIPAKSFKSSVKPQVSRILVVVNSHHLAYSLTQEDYKACGVKLFCQAREAKSLTDGTEVLVIEGFPEAVAAHEWPLI